MATAAELSLKILQALRRQGGVLSSAELQEQLGASQPTVSRALAPLIQSGQVQKVGAARAQRDMIHSGGDAQRGMQISAHEGDAAVRGRRLDHHRRLHTKHQSLATNRDWARECALARCGDLHQRVASSFCERSVGSRRRV